jgi:hypothetical protein
MCTWLWSGTEIVGIELVGFNGTQDLNRAAADQINQLQTAQPLKDTKDGRSKMKEGRNERRKDSEIFNQYHEWCSRT